MLKLINNQIMGTKTMKYLSLLLEAIKFNTIGTRIAMFYYRLISRLFCRVVLGWQQCGNIGPGPDLVAALRVTVPSSRLTCSSDVWSVFIHISDLSVFFFRFYFVGHSVVNSPDWTFTLATGLVDWLLRFRVWLHIFLKAHHQYHKC